MKKKTNKRASKGKIARASRSRAPELTHGGKKAGGKRKNSALRIPHKVPKRAQIQQFFVDTGEPAKLKEIATAFNLNAKERDGLHLRMRRMLDDGQLVLTKHKAFTLPDESQVYRGKVLGNSDGYGFVAVDGLDEDIYLAQEQMRFVFPGDTINVMPIKEKNGRIRGAVSSIVEMRQQPIVGLLEKKGEYWRISPRDTRITQQLRIEDDQLLTARDGDIVSTRIVRHPFGRGYAEVKVDKVIGRPEEANIEIEIATLSYGIPNEFYDETIQAANAIPAEVLPQEIEGRLDLRQLPLVTIDGADARDFDDAVYCEKKGSGWTLIVAIADVSHYVERGSALDKDAVRRGTSVYFPRNVIPMLPEALSNGICSLNPEVDRLCMACTMHIDRQGIIKSYQFDKAVMHSKARLKYSEVNEFFDGNNAAIPSEIHNDITELKAVYEAFISERDRRGALNLEVPEPKFIIGEDLRISGVTVRHRGIGERLIEECMLAANVSAALYLFERELPAPNRVHEKPDSERLEQLRIFLRIKGLSLGGKSEPMPQDYNAVLSSQKMTEDLRAVVQPMLLRSMKQARYSTANLGHYALNYEHYAHFTSPIRRYPDLMVHRQIAGALKGNVPYKDNEKVEELAIQCSDYERRADEATRDVMKRLQAEYMLEHLGDEFEGTISGVASFGVFVFISSMGVDGMVHVSELPDDWYDYDAQLMRIVGRSSGRKFSIGDHVRVQVVRVDVAEGKIDMTLV